MPKSVPNRNKGRAIKQTTKPTYYAVSPTGDTHCLSCASNSEGALVSSTDRPDLSCDKCGR